MFHGKPIIGLVGGIGSGKSFVAQLFAEQGCKVIDSDAQVRAAYREPMVIDTLKQWWGAAVVNDKGEVDRAWIAGKVFNDPAEKHRLEQFLHPLVDAARRREMSEAANDERIVAFVWDTPLLCESGLARACDFVIFIDTPEDIRRQRVRESRGWSADELARREKFQWPLDKKRAISHDVFSNTAGAAQAREHVRELIPRILAQVSKQSASGGLHVNEDCSQLSKDFPS